MKFLLGKKSHMTQVFDTEGNVKPVTVIAFDLLVVSGIRDKEKDGHAAVVIGFGNKTKLSKGKKVKVPLKNIEFKLETSEYSVGDIIESGKMFEKGDIVKLSAISKGKGFQGVVKRYGFSGGPRTHGQKHNERAPGAIGAGLRARVPKGQKMPGRTGGNQITLKGVEVVDVSDDYLLLSGSVPGRSGTIVKLESI